MKTEVGSESSEAGVYNAKCGICGGGAPRALNACLQPAVKCDESPVVTGRNKLRRVAGGFGFAGAAVVGLVAACLVGCTAESVRIAAETQRRADEIQQTIIERQQQALRELLFRELAGKLQDNGVVMTDGQRELLNQAWNDRDLLEFWSVQNERSKALRLIGVDSRLYSEQSIVDLLVKSMEAKADRARQGAAAFAGAEAARQAAQNGSQGTTP